MESRQHALEMSQALKEIADALGLVLIYKTSFDKANRTSIDSPSGVGMDTAKPVFQEVREKTGCPVLTDVHEPDQCEVIDEAVVALTITAYHCRRTDVLVAAGRTGRAMNVKKGQFIEVLDRETEIG